MDLIDGHYLLNAILLRLMLTEWYHIQKMYNETGKQYFYFCLSRYKDWNFRRYSIE